MVLNRRGRVLGVVLGFVLSVVPLGGCSESLFGDQRAGQGSGSDGPPSPCQAPCVADASAEFNGTPRGAGMHWRYVEDHRDRTWKVMSVVAGQMTGEVSGNRIAACAASPDAPACSALPGALLVSSAGGTTMADPAIEFTAPASQVIRIGLKAFVPIGEDLQTIRLYRNSREDELFTATPSAGVPFEHEITLDALAGDRFLVAVAPIDGGAINVGLQLVATDAGQPFPSTCQLALSFAGASGNTLDDPCGHSIFTFFTGYPARNASSPRLDTWSFAEQGLAATVHANEFFERDMALLDWSGDMTAQFWFKLDQPIFNSPIWLFSDRDPNYGGGIGISITSGSFSNVNVSTWVGPNAGDTGTITGTQYPIVGSWQFIRVVRAGGRVTLCMNGQYKNAVLIGATPPAGFATMYPLNLGIDPVESTSGAFFEGMIDDVRVIADVLPCG